MALQIVETLLTAIGLLWLGYILLIPFRGFSKQLGPIAKGEVSVDRYVSIGPYMKEYFMRKGTLFGILISVALIVTAFLI